MDLLNEIYYVENGVLLGYHGKSRLLTIPEGIHTIGSNVFTGSNLERVTIPGYVEKVCENAFLNSKIEVLDIQEGVKKLEENAFKNCLRLREITIPSTLVPIFNAVQIFGESPNVEVIYIDKLNSKILFFLEEKAFPNLKRIVLGYNNSEIYVSKLMDKISSNVKIVFEDDWKFTDDKEIDELLESIRKKVSPVLPSYINKIFKNELSHYVDRALSDDYKILRNKLQSIVFKLDEMDYFHSLIHSIDLSVSIMDDELYERPKNAKSSVDKCRVIHYLALKYNDIELSKRMESIFQKISNDIVQYFLYLKTDVKNYSFMETKKYDALIDELYREVKDMYETVYIGEYVDLIDEIRGESNKSDSIFASFNTYLRQYSHDELLNRPRKDFRNDNFIDISKAYDRLAYYGKFISGEIRSIIKGEFTRYPDCTSLRYDLMKDFKNRDEIFANFYNQYIMIEGLKPYYKLLNTLRKFRNQSEYDGFTYDYDEEIFNLLNNVSLLIDSMEVSDEYEETLNKITSEYEAKINKDLRELPKDADYYSKDVHLYLIQSKAEEYRSNIVSELSILINQMENGFAITNSSNSIVKVIGKAINIVQDKGKDESFLSRIEIKTISIYGKIKNIEDSVISSSLKDKLIDVLRRCKASIKDVKTEPEKYVLEELDKVRDLITQYMDAVSSLEKIKNVINSKEVL